ncbi:MAG: polyprenyl synthetase family protein [Proteobacteria bacterium]|nr:polyprenyl synthetase family protein [Pseudomonadota bacterium]
MFDLKEYLTSRQAEINVALNDVLNAYGSGSPRVLEAMRYSLLAGGKRIRPILCLAACEAVCGQYQHAMTAAVALEMIHTYSLIHDDLPAMDNDDLRRGNLTCHKKFDEATAILAGDALLTQAFYILSDPAGLSDKNAYVLLKIIREMAKGAGISGMIAGQMLDIESERKILTRDQLENIHNMKTGALIEASVLSGAMIGDGDEKTLLHLSGYAKNIGLAFQVADDILNIEGDPDIMGKAVGTDADRNKNTYPSILGLENSKEFAKDLVEHAIGALSMFDEKALPLRHIASYVIQRKK